jgi:hypothetical protein
VAGTREYVLEVQPCQDNYAHILTVDYKKDTLALYELDPEQFLTFLKLVEVFLILEVSHLRL